MSILIKNLIIFPKHLSQIKQLQVLSFWLIFSLMRSNQISIKEESALKRICFFSKNIDASFEGRFTKEK